MKTTNIFTLFLLLSLALSACSPSIQMTAPEKPILISLNVNVKQDIKVSVEKDVDELFNQKKVF